MLGLTKVRRSDKDFSAQSEHYGVTNITHVDTKLPTCDVVSEPADKLYTHSEGTYFPHNEVQNSSHLLLLHVYFT